MKVDIVIIGGGLAGLSAGIMARRMGWSVVLIEKKAYPFHKVCGEYISLESEKLLRWLGLPVSDWNLPVIHRFVISNPKGNRFESPLPLGGIGISRFTLDHFLKQQLEAEGGLVLSPVKVTSCERIENGFLVQTTDMPYPEIESKMVFGSFGRNKPHFVPSESEKNTGTNFIGVKFHVKADLPTDRIELHHFPGGYCGISAIEDAQFCMCYLLQESFAKKFKGNFDEIERQLLSINPILKRYLSDFQKVTPIVSTGGVFFQPRPLTGIGMLFLGDSAGMIAPLAGNGMSMALHSAVLAIEAVRDYLSGNETIEVAEARYSTQWKTAFSHRLKMARVLQKAMESPLITGITINAFRAIPGLFRWTASKTHGIEVPIPKIKS